MVETVMDVLREKLPEHHDRLVRLRDRRPDRFMGMIEKLAPVVGDYLKLRERSQELADTIIEEFKIEETLRDLSRQYRDAAGDPEAQASCEHEIRQLVQRQFELQLQRREDRLRSFAERLEEQRRRLDVERAKLQEERANVETLVTDRVEAVKEGRLRDHPGPRGPRHGRHGDRGRGPGRRHRDGRSSRDWGPGEDEPPHPTRAGDDPHPADVVED
jgi:hypothetical protein